MLDGENQKIKILHGYHKYPSSEWQNSKFAQQDEIQRTSKERQALQNFISAKVCKFFQFLHRNLMNYTFYGSCMHTLELKSDRVEGRAEFVISTGKASQAEW